MLKGGISLSAMRMIGQVMPQIRLSTTSMMRAPKSACVEAGAARSGFLTRAELSTSFGCGGDEPVGDLRAGPEQHVGLVADDLENAAQVLRPMRRSHDVGMHRDRH